MKREKIKNLKPVICYPKENLDVSNLSIYKEARKHLKIIDEIIVSPRDARCFEVKKSQFFRIENIEGPLV